MSLLYIRRRTWLNFKRHRYTVVTAIIAFSSLMFLFGAIYPGTEGVQTYANIGVIQTLTGIGELGTISSDLGMFIWLLILSNFIVLIIPVMGIFLGIRMLPFNERDGKELIFSTDKSVFWYFLENFILAMILIPLIIAPVYLVAIAFLSPTSELVLNMTIAFVLPVFFTMVVAMITVFGASIKMSNRIGYAFGGIFYIVSFTLNLLSSELDFVKNFNLMTQINTFEHALNKTWNESYILTCIALVTILFVLTIFFLHRTDFIEGRSSYSVIDKSSGKIDIKSKFSIFHAPMAPFLSRVGWKYPAFRDQLQSSAGIFLIYAFISSMLIVVVLVSYPGDEAMGQLFGELSSIVNNPLVAAFMFGHEGTATLEGFLLFKLMTFHWIYYGPFIFMAVYYIVMRDKNDGYDEITWSMPRKRSSILMQRTGAMLMYLWLIIVANWIAFWIGELILSSFADVVAPHFLSTIISFGFLGLGYSLFLLVFTALAVIPHPKYIVITLVSAFMVTIFLPVISFMYQDTLAWVAYFSPFKYFDVAGLLLDKVDVMGDAVPTILIGITVGIILYFASLLFITPKKDIS